MYMLVHRAVIALIALTTGVAIAVGLTSVRSSAPSTHSARPQAPQAAAQEPVQAGCIQPPDPMIGWWTFDDLEYFDSTHDDGYLDKAGVNNVGEPIGGPMVPITGSHVANAIALNGRDQYVRVADHPELAFGTGDLTIDAWIRIDKDDPGTGRRPIVDKSAPGPTGAPYGYTLFLEDGHLGFTMSGMNGSLADIVSQAPVKDGWHLVAVTVERAANPTGAVGTLYINNNTPEGFAVAPSTEAVDNSADFLIGTDIPGLDRQDQHYFWGGIDEVELLRRALTPEEIGAIYASGPAGKCKKPVFPPAPGDPIKNNWTFHGVELVNIDVVNQCENAATGFRFVLSALGTTPEVNSTNYSFKDVFEVSCPAPTPGPTDCNPFTPQQAVPVYTAGGVGTAGSIELGWHATGTETLGIGQTGHFGYSLLPIVNHMVTAQLTVGTPPSTLCEAMASSITWSQSGVEVTMTLHNGSRTRKEVVTRAMASEQRVALGDLVPSNAALMRGLGAPLAATVLDPGGALTVTLGISTTDVAAVVLADWYDHDGARGALRAREFRSRSLEGAMARPNVRRYFPWAGHLASPGVISTSSEN